MADRLGLGKVPIPARRTLPGLAAPERCLPDMAAACELHFLQALQDRDRAIGERLAGIERELEGIRELVTQLVPHTRKGVTTPPAGTVEVVAGPVKARGTMRQIAVLVLVVSLVGGAAYVAGTWGPPNHRPPAEKVESK